MLNAYKRHIVGQLSQRFDDAVNVGKLVVVGELILVLGMDLHDAIRENNESESSNTMMNFLDSIMREQGW